MVVLTILSRSWPGNLSWARLSKVRRTSAEIVARVRRPLLHPLDVSAWTVKAFFPFPLISVIRASCFRDVTIEPEPRRGRRIMRSSSFHTKPIDTEFRVPATNTRVELEISQWLIRISDASDRDRDDCRRVVSWKFGVLNLEWSIAGLTNEQLGGDSLRDLEEGRFWWLRDFEVIVK